MEKIHDPDGRAWISERVAPGDYFKQFSQLVEAEKPLRDMSDLSSKWTMKHMGLEDSNMFTKVEEVMNIANLTTEDEVEPMQINDPIGDSIQGETIPKFYKTPIPPESQDQLRTLAHQENWLNTTRNQPSSKQRRKRQSRHDNDHWFLADKPEAQHKNWDMVDRAVVYCVRIYRPSKHLVPGQPVINPLRYTQEIWMLGHHTLAQLRDYIWCSVDLNIVGAQQVDTLQRPGLKARDKYKSGLIYIDGVFYVDRRDKNNIDYSEPIRKWAEDPKREIGPFTVENMEDTRIDSLQFRVGYPYVYIHQGNHEHLLSFVDIRLLSTTDPQKVGDYPLIRSLGNQAAKYCMICQTSIAVWVTMDNIRVPEDPFFFCASCYKHFNFVDKKRVGSFREFRYYDVNVL